jgi:hypothetical protein
MIGVRGPSGKVLAHGALHIGLIERHPGLARAFRLSDAYACATPFWSFDAVNVTTANPPRGKRPG